MDRTRFIEHRGKRIVLLDFKELRQEDEALAEVARARAFFETLPRDGSLLTLTDARDCIYTRVTLNAMKEMTRDNRERVRAAAVVASNAMHRVGVTAIALFSKRKLQVFSDLESARDWLVQQ